MKKRIRQFSGTTSGEVSALEIRNREAAQRAAEEGIVLLKNEGVLPFAKHAKIALFGGGADHTIKGGTGSGDVNERESISVRRGMEAAGLELTSIAWLEEYRDSYTKAREAWRDKILTEAGGPDSARFFDTYAANAFRIPTGRMMEKEDLGDACAAVYVLSRVAGEGADRRDVKGDYYLSDDEAAQLKTLAGLCDDIVVLLNMGAQIDLKEILAIPQIKAVMLISQPGMEGGTAVGRVLAGEVTPSGRLTDTWTYNYEDFQNSETFGFKNGDVTKEYYEDGIYVGYRYFDAFGVEPVYPFGYGLSYTSFEMKSGEITADGREVKMDVTVTNTGSVYSGKEVVQVYAACPQGTMTKEMKRLAGFAKTKELAPGESQTVTVVMDAKSFASFDEQKSAWMIGQGTYIIMTGNSSASAVPAGALLVKEDAVLEEVAHICPLQEHLEEITADAAKLQEVLETYEETVKREGYPVVEWVPEKITHRPLTGNHLDEMAEALIAKLSDEQLAMMTIGELSSNHNIALGAAGIMVPGAAGETCSILDEEYDIPGIAVADGPAGIRVMQEYLADTKEKKIYTQGFLGALEHGYFIDKLVVPGTTTYYQFCTAIPVGVMLAQTWNIPLLEEVGEAVGRELAYLGVTLWLAPGMNIHRNPLCGRNFEYYSEDPLISGCMAAAVTRGVQSVPGVGTTIKHFACNNQEDNRVGCSSILSERALREIYLRGFEIAVKTSQPMSIMTSYNLINGLHTANTRDLCMTAAREEWGFEGAVMTDWTTTSPHGGSLAWKCISSGNDLIMPGEPGDKENILAALESGELKREELEGCVHRLLKIIYQSLGYEDCVSYGLQFGYADERK